MSKEKEQEYIADGLTENIITSLSQIPKIFVIAQNSVFVYKGKPVTVQQVAEDLAVQYVLEGSVQQIDDRVRINVQLIDAIKGHYLWAKRYDREIKDIFDLQDEITLKIVISISGKLGEKEEALVRHRSTNNLEAWSYAIKSLPAGGPQRDINRKAKKDLERAVEIDPKYAWAWSRLAMIHYWDAMFGFSESRNNSVKIGLELALKAIALDENLPEGRVALALLLYLDKQYDLALAEARKGVSLGPNNSENLARAGQVMFFSGRFEGCLELIKRAIRFDPNHGTVHLRFLAGALRYTGRYDEAIVAFNRMVEMRKGTYGEFMPHIFLASLYAELDRMEEAKFHAKASLEIKFDSSIEWMRKSQPFKKSEDMERMVEGMRKAGFPEK
jgi:TolB-like protein